MANKYLNQQENNYKKVCDEVKKTKNLLKNNTTLIEQIYNKLENGDLYKSEKNSIFTLKKIPNIVKLFGDNNNNMSLNNLQLQIDEVTDFDSDNDEKKSKKSDSSQSLVDFDVVCQQNTTPKSVN